MSKKTKKDLEREIRRLEAENKRLAAMAGEFKGKWLDEKRWAQQTFDRVTKIRDYILMRKRGLEALSDVGMIKSDVMVHKTMAQVEISGLLAKIQEGYVATHSTEYGLADGVDGER